MWDTGNFLETDTRQGHRDQRDKLVQVTQDSEGMGVKKGHEGTGEVAGGTLLNKIYFS